MANKRTRVSYGGINQDLSKSRRQGTEYFDANNVKLSPVEGETFGALSNAYGNKLAAKIPSPVINSGQKKIYYGSKVLDYTSSELDTMTNSGEPQQIIGHIETTNGAILFTTNNIVDCIWNVNNLDVDILDIDLLYIRNMGFSTERPIQAVFNYENALIQKVYWVDGSNYLRFVNIMESIDNGYNNNLIDLPVASINSKSTIDISRPYITDSGGGGVHKAGMIQYAYTLYNLNGAETSLSPLSDLFPLDKGEGQGGGDVNEVVGALPIVHIDNIDEKYEYLKLYSVVYTTYNGIPSIELVYDGRVGNYTEFTFNDTGTKTLDTLSAAEFLFLGADPIKPSHIVAKDNILFAANNTTTAYKVEIDTRAYSYNAGASSADIYTDIVYEEGLTIPYNGTKWDVVADGLEIPTEFDCVNLDFDTFRYQSDGTSIGGQGKYVSYKLLSSTETEVNLPLKQAKFFKDNEVYRIGVVFFNSIGQSTEAKWISDFKARQGNLEGSFNTIEVEFNAAFYAYIATLSDESRPTNYIVVRALRYAKDKTIISQGIMTGMFVQDYTKNRQTTDTYAKRAARNSSLVKTPIPLTRGYGDGKGLTDSYYPIFPTKHNITMNESHNLEDPSRPAGDQDPGGVDIISDEIYADTESDNKRQQSWQYTKMFQMYSPETTFHTEVTVTDKDELHVLGHMERDKYQWWDFSINYQTLGPFLNYMNAESLHGDPAHYSEYVPSGFGIIGPGYRTFKDDQTPRPEYQGIETNTPVVFSRRIHAHKTFLPLNRVNSSLSYKILSNPEIAEVGQNIQRYNNDNSLQYINKLSLVVSDSKLKDDGGADPISQVASVASDNNRCLTMVLGEQGLDHETRVGLDDLYTDVKTDLGDNKWDVELFGEVRKPLSYIYSGALYGGYDYISRSRTEYVGIGPVNNIEDNNVFIPSPGDTFVQTFINTRLTKQPGTVYNKDNMTIVETLEYLVETTINLEERNDSSIRGWNTVVDPTAEEGTNYNTVYSTDATIRTYTTDSTKIRAIERSETQIIASKVKTPGEFVDNWVDFQPNEIQSLDGKYGPITGLLNHWDQVYAWQDFAVAQISINPRVQTQGDDGVTIELGSGKVLHDYQYISTKSGSLNKWGIVSTNSGIYYVDAINKQLQRIQPRKGIEGVSESKGLHSFLQRKVDRDIIRIDNPVELTGAVTGYDTVNGDIYTTILQNDEVSIDPKESFNIAFNEKLNSYTSFYSFVPTRYITKGERVFTVPQNNNELWVHGQKNFQSFYGEKFASDITLVINTDVPGVEKVFDSIEYDSEVLLDGDTDVPKATLDTIEAWTTYQHSDKLELVVGNNIKRKFRTWRAFIPRESGTRNRLRDKWLYLKLGFNPEDNNKLILHDIIINYTV